MQFLEQSYTEKLFIVGNSNFTGVLETLACNGVPPENDEKSGEELLKGHRQEGTQ